MSKRHKKGFGSRRLGADDGVADAERNMGNAWDWSWLDEEFGGRSSAKVTDAEINKVAKRWTQNYKDQGAEKDNRAPEDTDADWKAYWEGYEAGLAAYLRMMLGERDKQVEKDRADGFGDRCAIDKQWLCDQMNKREGTPAEKKRWEEEKKRWEEVNKRLQERKKAHEKAMKRAHVHARVPAYKPPLPRSAKERKEQEEYDRAKQRERDEEDAIDALRESGYKGFGYATEQLLDNIVAGKMVKYPFVEWGLWNGLHDAKVSGDKKEIAHAVGKIIDSFFEYLEVEPSDEDEAFMQKLWGGELDVEVKMSEVPANNLDSDVDQRLSIKITR